jgi:hypothetical protein
MCAHQLLAELQPLLAAMNDVIITGVIDSGQFGGPFVCICVCVCVCVCVCPSFRLGLCGPPLMHPQRSRRDYSAAGVLR